MLEAAHRVHLNVSFSVFYSVFLPLMEFDVAFPDDSALCCVTDSVVIFLPGIISSSLLLMS